MASTEACRDATQDSRSHQASSRHARLQVVGSQQLLDENGVGVTDDDLPHASRSCSPDRLQTVAQTLLNPLSSQKSAPHIQCLLELPCGGIPVIEDAQHAVGQNEQAAVAAPV